MVLTLSLCFVFYHVSFVKSSHVLVNSKRVNSASYYQRVLYLYSKGGLWRCLLQSTKPSLPVFSTPTGTLYLVFPMRPQQMVTFFLPAHLFATTIFLLIITLPASHGFDYHKNCSSLVSCGKLKKIGYPFWGLGRDRHCGHPALQLTCPHNQSDDLPILQLYDEEELYQVLSINKSHPTMTIELRDLPNQDSISYCPDHIILTNFTGRDFFNLSPRAENILLSVCPAESTEDSNVSFTCASHYSGNITVHYLNNKQAIESNHCDVIKVPVLIDGMNGLNRGHNLLNVLMEGFEVNFSEEYYSKCAKCEGSGGICGSSDTLDYYCSKNQDTWKLVLGLAIPGGFILIAINVGLCCYLKPKFRSQTILSRIISSDLMKSDLESGYSMHGLPVFSYSELQEATNNFDATQELGDGGFGIVYYGKLTDGREVAVKRLYEKNYKRVGQFMTEVDILTRLRHQNLVTLYGCTSRHSRELLLVYEYISNGTVADHLYGDRTGSGAFTWTIRMKIAIETASALSYLHTSDIIHRDVKTNNILLDKNFSVKVADFGLSRLFPGDMTHVSTAPQGTPGYLDPAYHKCYQVTNKSDVYSFGVVLVELISSLPAVDIRRQDHEINLSDYAMNRIQQGVLDKLVDQNLGFGSDFKVTRMITLVAELAFQCLQQEKEVRPCMTEVHDSLKEIEDLDYEALEAEEMDPTTPSSKPTSVAADNDSEPLPPSPSSVIDNWVMRSSASNTSS